MDTSSNWLYSDIVKEHFTNPRNVLIDMKDYKEDGKGTIGNIKCGDQMTVAIKVDKDKGVITDCKWNTYGCASAIASTSIMSEMVTGMTLVDAYHLSPKDISKNLGGLPEHKIHCSVLGDKALRAAIDDYYKRNGMEDRIEKEKAKVICKCLNITDHEIEQAVLDGAHDFIELQERTKISTVCGQCKDEAMHVLEKYKKKHLSS